MDQQACIRVLLQNKWLLSQPQLVRVIEAGLDWAIVDTNNDQSLIVYIQGNSVKLIRDAYP